MSLEKLQKLIEKQYPRPIRLEKTKKKRKELLHDFLIKFFTEWVNERATVYVDTKEVQTKTKGQHKTMRRSLGDIYMICKYYYPDIDLGDVVHELYINLPQSIQKGFRSSYCFALNKRTFYYDPDQANQVYNKTNNDEYGHPYRWYLSFFVEEEEEPEICPDCGEFIEDCECED